MSVNSPESDNEWDFYSLEGIGWDIDEKDDFSNAEFRYDGDISSLDEFKVRDREENGLFKNIDGIGDTCSYGEFIESATREIIEAQKTQRNVGFYFTVDQEVPKEDITEFLTKLPVVAEGNNPSYNQALGTSIVSGLAAVGAGAAVLSGTQLHDPLMGINALEVFAGTTSAQAAKSIYDLKKEEKDFQTEIQSNLTIGEIETIPEGRQTYFLNYDTGSGWGKSVIAPLDYDGSENGGMI
ncbi:hypothetical protein [Candidatus Nanohalococcus occultus]|uniref:Uncharacterized protein n=1 Tax=Candidatus Nanohalococcus occultus TaxID=2978047 RepID=A0ABY8CEN4_9ARCH|nr:hypothetical protein SVXNc_0649 [Candidatus Nanohaloarchaeota archaeon SVXNc]